MRRTPLLVVAACVLAGCDTTSSSTSPGPVPEMPQNFRAMVIERSQDFFFDPFSIREPTISAPFTYTTPYGNRAAVCVRANAKNRTGGYIGLRYHLFAFNGGQISNVYSDNIDSNCVNLIYAPFTELESGGTPVVSAPARAQR